jgi:hypothetical protein
MRTEEIVDFIKENIEPLPAIPPYGERYRAAATLKDGLHLPCVVFESASRYVELALKRFEETRQKNILGFMTRRKNNLGFMMDYPSIVRSFVATGNAVNDHDISEVAVSAFAIPLARMREIGGETSMGWTEFYATMTDGTEFCFGTRYLTEFFEMPNGHTVGDIKKIVPAIHGEMRRHERVYRERPFFTCYINGL